MKVGFVSLGCPKNLVDGEVMLGMVREAGHTITTDAGEADVLVVNTCAFIDSAKQESIDAILEMAAHKRTGQCRRLVVTGCLAERYRGELQTHVPDIDAVVGTGEVPMIVSALSGLPEPPPSPAIFYRRESLTARSGSDQPANGRPSSADACAAAAPLPSYLYDAGTPRILTTPRHFAYVKIAEGCDYTCAFCIIPSLRGRYRSRSVESVVDEGRRLAAAGVRELILVSQDTSFFGIDREDRDALPRLLRALDRLDDLRWIRLLYLYPTTITDDLLDTMAGCEKVCSYVDLPLQHVATAVLRRMRRPGDEATYARLIQRIRDRVPGVALRTTFIVGFPGETPEEFDQLCRFVERTGFDHVGVFTYSHEEGTRAYRLRDDVPVREKRRRRRILMHSQQRWVRNAHCQRIGTTVQVLIDGPAADHPLALQGRLEGQAPEIDPVVYLTEADASRHLPGRMISAEIVGAWQYDLVARPLP